MGGDRNIELARFEAGSLQLAGYQRHIRITAGDDDTFRAVDHPDGDIGKARLPGGRVGDKGQHLGLRSAHRDHRS